MHPLFERARSFHEEQNMWHAYINRILLVGFLSVPCVVGQEPASTSASPSEGQPVQQAPQDPPGRRP